MVNRSSSQKESDESVDHFQIHYKRTKEIWIFLLGIIGLKGVFPESMRNLLLEWKFKGVDKKRHHVW